MLTRALAPWLLLAVFVLLPVLTAVGVAGPENLAAVPDVAVATAAS